jgi:hypothetical protein
VIEGHYVCNGAQRNQVEVSRRHAGSVLQSLALEPASERRHEVESHTHAGKVAAGEAAAREVRIHDHRRIGHLAAGQVMIRNQHRHAQPVRLFYARETRDTVVDGDQQGGRTFGCDADDFRRQSVAELEAVRHKIADVCKPELSQAAQQQHGTRRTVDVEVPDYRNP